jgi:hypothetical protein
MFKSRQNRNYKPSQIMPIQAKIVKKELPVLSFEDFLREHKIDLSIEIWGDCTKDRRYRVNTKPYVCIEANGGGANYGASGIGPFADMALRDFIGSIQGKRLTLDAGRTYFTCEEFEWDGILREQVQINNNE